jgi:hypothetical protein
MHQVGPDPRPSWPRGWPAGQDLRRFDPKLGCHESTRVGGPPELSGALLIAQARKLCQNPSASDRVSRL